MSISKATVLMPVYNGQNYLRDAIESILKQTFTDFEFLIINDGSADSSVEIIKSYADPRIKLVENAANLGLIATLNKGIALAKGEYIVRMDCDDISFPERLAKQISFMESHPKVGVCGSWFKTFGNAGSKISRYSSDSDIIKARLLFDSVLGHPTVVMRRKFFQDKNLYYDPSYKHAEDYELWFRAVQCFDIACLGEVLLNYREHSQQVSQRLNQQQVEMSGKVRLIQINKLGLYPSAEEFAVHQAISSYSVLNEKKVFERADAWLCKLKKANDDIKIYPEPAFSKVLAERLITFCNKTSSGGWWTRKVLDFDLLNITGLGKQYLILFLLKTMWDRGCNNYYRLKFK